MPEALKLVGEAASPGLAHGPAHMARPPGAPRAAVRAPQTEEAALRHAIETAVADLRVLMQEADRQSAGILEFQIEMLLDPMIVAPALERIAGGNGAAFAWVAALDDYICGFTQSDDAHVRARAGDMVDIRNQVLRALNGEERPDFPRGAIFVGRDIVPSQFLSHDWSRGGGILLFQGSTASHVAMLARSHAVPMVVGTGVAEIADGTGVTVDGGGGFAVVGGKRAPSASSPRSNDAGKGNETRPIEADHTADGEAIAVRANINHPSELRALDAADVAGIGLLRSEFLIARPADLADEDRQTELYRQALLWAGGRPVTIRLMDFGGDKPLPAEGAVGSSSCLGRRGIRLLLARPEMLRVQVRALLRAAAAGDLRVLVPMVTDPSEIDETRRVFSAEAEALARAGFTVAVPAIGMMVEVPAAAIMLDRFANADFFSIGTNDLAQYLSAAARDDAAVSVLYRSAAPAVLRLVNDVMVRAAAMGKPIAICGDMAADLRSLAALLSAGLRDFSMAPAEFGRFRNGLAGLRASGDAVEA